MDELKKVKLDVLVDTVNYNAIEIDGTTYYRKDWMVWKMVEYAKAKLEQADEVRKKDILPTCNMQDFMLHYQSSKHDFTDNVTDVLKTYKG